MRSLFRWAKSSLVGEIPVDRLVKRLVTTTDIAFLSAASPVFDPRALIASPEEVAQNIFGNIQG
jgi:hypothetical protein